MNINWKNVQHWVAALLIFGIPLILTNFPKAGDLTVSAILMAIYHFASAKVQA